MNFTLSRSFALALLALAATVALPTARADVLPTVNEPFFRVEGPDFTWHLMPIELSGLQNEAVQRRVQAQLDRATRSARTKLERRAAALVATETTPRGPIVLNQRTRVTLLTDRLLSVAIHTYLGHRYIVEHDSLTIDLRTGSRVPRGALFGPGATDRVAALVEGRRSRSGVELPPIAAADLRQGGRVAVAVERDGLVFLIGKDPSARGPSEEVRLSFAELEGLVATDGVVGTLVASRPPAHRPPSSTVGLTGGLRPR